MQSDLRENPWRSLKEELKYDFFCPIQFTQKLDLEDKRTSMAIFLGAEARIIYMEVLYGSTSSEDDHSSHTHTQKKKTITYSALN